MTIRELRKQAKGVGMPNYISANRAELEDYLYGEDAEALQATQPIADMASKESPNVATVCDAGGRIVRTYTLEIHGQSFADLARQFAGKYDGYTVATKYVGKDQPQVREGTVERNSSNPNATMVLSQSSSIVRIYTEKQHGQGYEDLAKQFIKDRFGYTIELVRVT